MRPLDQRLLRHARRSAVHVGVLIALGTVAAALVIAQAQVLAGAISGVFLRGLTLSGLAGSLTALAVIFGARAIVAWATEASSYRASAAVKSDLRRRLLAHAVVLGPRWLAGKRSGELVMLATQGIDGLDGYFAAYLPQLVLAVLVPLAVVMWIGSADLLAGITIVLTLPLIPLFGALIGRATAHHTRRRWRALALLAHHFLDVVAGLPTLKVFGRAKAQAQTINRVTGDYRQATMGTLRLAFLSSLVLELTATLSVALVAVGIGLRLVYGHLGLRTGLLVLILAPEAYLPLRQAAAQFHASADGLTAVNEVFAVLETPAPGAGAPAAARGQAPRRKLPAPDPAAITVQDVSVSQPGRIGTAPLRCRMSLARGEFVALTGPSGCGKSTLIAALLGFARPSTGRIMVRWAGGETDLELIEPDDWRGLVGWLPQDPLLFHGTVASNIRLGWPDAPGDAVAAAANAAALHEVGLDTPIGERGQGLSAGQRRRVAFARAVLPGPRGTRPVLLADEPTAGLDPAAAAQVIRALSGFAAAGRAVLVVTHNPAALAAAGRVLTLGSAAAALRVSPAVPAPPAVPA